VANDLDDFANIGAFAFRGTRCKVFLAQAMSLTLVVLKSRSSNMGSGIQIEKVSALSEERGVARVVEQEQSLPFIVAVSLVTTIFSDGFSEKNPRLPNDPHCGRS